jgi:hypothetical protein
MADKIYLQLEIQAMNENDILGMIDSVTLAGIKRYNPHPFFRAFSLCHEGTSQPKILGETKQQPISWGRKAIQSIKDIVLKGIKFFKGHNEDSSTNGRESFGEVIANKEIEIAGKLHHVIVGYFPDKEKVKDDDIISQEGLWTLVKQGGQIIADKVEEITGIAMSNSKIDKPAFENARQLAEIQCFEKEFIQASGEDADKNKTGGDPVKNKEVVMTLNDVISYIKENKVNISQLNYTIEDVRKDRELGKIFDEAESLKKDKDSLTAKELEYKKQINDFSRKEQMQTAKGRLNTIIAGKKLTEVPKTFIEKSFEEEVEKMVDITDDSLSKFVDSKFGLFQKVMSTSKDKNDIIISSGDGKDGKESDFSLPANNELLRAPE